MSERKNGTGGFIRELKRIDRRRSTRDEREKKGVWFGLGMIGLVGWSVAIPTLIGAAAGILLDTRTDTRYSWTIMLLFAGVITGSVIAWMWVNREQQKIRSEKDREKEEKEE
ncbi:MAG: AtpZ/AtpI family protein [Spirochaetia bacterium]